MVQDTNEHVQMAHFQNLILQHLNLNPGEAVFDYSGDENRVALNLITINPEHNQSFLFHTAEGHDKISALKAMLEYTTSSRDRESSFTIQWAVRGESVLHTSYFRGSDVFDVLQKFTHGRDKNTVVIYSVSLNPQT